MKRTALYYPTIEIPNGAWLRGALFYFDEVASIVPRAIIGPNELGEFLVPTSPEIDFLRGEGAFRPVSPEQFQLGNNWPLSLEFSNDFLAATAGFTQTTGRRMVQIHRGKVAENVLWQLRQRNLVEDLDGNWLKVEENTARIFMGMLAQYLADIDTEATVPNTDCIEYEGLLYGSQSGDGFVCIESRFTRAIPTPREDVSLGDILDFKRRRADELLEYRTCIDELQDSLSKSESRSEAKHAMVKFEERQKKALANLTAASNDAKLATVLGTLKTLIKTGQPAIWGAAAAVTAYCVPAVALALSGLAVGATIEAAAYLVDRRNEKRAAARNASFAYVQHAQQEHII